MSSIRSIVPLAVALLGASCVTPPPPVELPPPPAPGLPQYYGSVSIDPETGQLAGVWRIAFAPDATMRDSVGLLLNGGLRVSAVEGTSVAGFAQDAEGDVVVRFAPRLEPGSDARLVVTASGIPAFGEDGINGIGPSWVELGLDSEWHPVFSGYDQQIVGTVRFILPDGWDAVASGSFETVGGTLVLRNDVPLIDIAFSAAPALDSAAAANATVYHVDAEPAAVERVLETANACAGDLNRRYGIARPMPRAKVVIAPRTGPGYARQNYVVITDVNGFEGAGLAHFLCHELAHFWSSGALALSPESWLNEAFAEYVAGRYVRDAFGAAAYAPILARWEEANTGTPPIWTPTTTTRPGPRVSYRKAPYLLHRFEERVGTETMDVVLHQYMVGRLPTTSALLEAIGRVAGLEHAAWFREELAK